MRLIGKGAFGEVYLAKYKPTNKIVALKQMGKELIKAMEKTDRVKTERKIMTINKSPYLVSLYMSFQTKDCLYLGMEYCPGGDLREFLNAIGTLEEPEAVLYFAEMIMAVHHLHSMNFIHRDLKPDNFLIDSRGHIKLADFGLSKATAESMTIVQSDLEKKRAHISLLPGQSLETLNEINLKNRFRRTTTLKTLENSGTVGPKGIKITRRLLAKSVVGSPEFMAPEVIAGINKQENLYGYEVDWWSLGCVLFEMIIGAPPFSGESPEEIFANISNWRSLVPQVLQDYTENMSLEFFSLIKGFLCDPVERLGPDIQKLKKHTFFVKHKVDWANLLNMEPPFIPNNPFPEEQEKS